MAWTDHDPRTERQTPRFSSTKLTVLLVAVGLFFACCCPVTVFVALNPAGVAEITKSFR